MVCYIYYTDVFVGHNNIDKLKKALEAELKDSELTDDLSQLVHGLCLFMGYPSCLCSLKLNVNESLQDISRKLIQDSEAVQSSHSISTLTLNCPNCIPKEILCKCCVISCIKELPTQSKCKCVKNTSQSCQCQGTNGKCCKDFLSGLEACLSLLNLKTDLEGCTCNGKDCCKTGTCINSQCNLCKPSKFSDNAMTGLGICPMNPRKLAERLDKFFGSGPKSSSGCSCTCGSGSSPSCCCLACQSCSSQNCSCGSNCSCAQALKLQTSQCPCKTFCLAINGIKIAADSGAMTCCEGGQKCHCELDGSGSGTNCQSTSTSSSGQKCCIVQDKSNYKHSVKCMLRRLVSYFKDLKSDISSPSKQNFKNCCELLCVLKTCEFLQLFYNNRNATGCNACKSKGCSGSSGKCCNGTISKCIDKDCCKDCEGCGAVKFSRALETLRFAGPCGQELYRTLDDFLYYCCNVFEPYVNRVQSTVQKARKSCQQCKTGGKHSSFNGCKSGSPSCQGCTETLKKLQAHKDILSLMTRGYVSSYDSASATWPSLTSSTPGSKCCGSLSPSCGCQSNCSSGSSCPSQCCPDCPQRKAAKIFLGILPCLYYGLKIVFERCDSNNSELWPEWQRKDGKNAKITEASGLRDFLYAWGIYGYLSHSTHAVVLPGLLGNLFTPDSKGSFDTLYDFVSDKYFSIHVSDASLSPSTVRQMLLWLYGLRFTSGFSSLVLHCKSLCSPFGKSFNADAFCYYIHTCSFILPVSFISFIETSDSTVANFFSDADSEWKSFSYPEDPFELLEMLCDFVRIIFVAFDFLSTQCKNYADCGGWRNCYFGGSCKKALENSFVPSGSGSSSSAPSNSDCSCSGHETYLCTASKSISNWDVHGKHCAQDKCLSANGSTCQDDKHNVPEPKKKPPSGQGKKCSQKCPHPLQRFLTHGSESKSPSKDYPFALPGIVPMGFSQQKLSSTGKSGLDLRDVIILFCKSGFYPLTRLAEFSVCVILRPPESLFELFAFFEKFKDSGVFKDHFASYVSGEPGSYSGSALTTAIKEFYGSWSSHSGSHSNDLFSLSYCNGPKGSSSPTCGPYLYPLIADAYNIFIENFLGTYLSFVCHLAPTFKEKLEEFHTEFSSSSCCSSGSCQKIVECPCALPKFYAQGFTFMSPQSLNVNRGTAKKCSDFLDQLKKVLQSNAPLGLLIKAIEEFLWSIRLP
ncbi:variant erythrocyte surface antigen-1 family protein, partial [Babesia divergens]